MEKEDWKNSFIRDRAKEALDGIWVAFAWEDTPEGHKYWEQVATRLDQMLNEHGPDNAE